MFDVKFVFLYTDAVLWFVLALVVFYARYALSRPLVAARWRHVRDNRTALAAAAVLSVFFVIALSDSVHFRRPLPVEPGMQQAWETRTVSLLDVVVGENIAGRERSYSAPFAMVDFDKTTVLTENGSERVFARLKGASPEIAPEGFRLKFIKKLAGGVMTAAVLLSALWLVLAAILAAARKISYKEALRRATAPDNPWRPAIIVWQGAIFLASVAAFLWPSWHILGTDATGNDALFGALKSVRTAFVIGSLATLTTLPFAVVLGICAGYFKGKVDDVIQYIYTTLSSIPSVLLIAASVLMVQVFIDKNPQLYATGLERADVRLFLLAAIIGMTSWAGLARLLRAETMKVSAMDFVTAARAFGVSHARIMARHVFPNVVHIVLIVTVLDFSSIVLYEAVLSYVGVGVDPVMDSFGSMINAAAVEMSRSPVIWWNLLAAFIFMVTMVLAANLFASGVREAFDPRAGGRHA